MERPPLHTVRPLRKQDRPHPPRRAAEPRATVAARHHGPVTPPPVDAFPVRTSCTLPTRDGCPLEPPQPSRGPSPGRSREAAFDCAPSALRSNCRQRLRAGGGAGWNQAPCTPCTSSRRSSSAPSPFATGSPSRPCASTRPQDGLADDWHLVHLGGPRGRRAPAWCSSRRRPSRPAGPHLARRPGPLGRRPGRAAGAGRPLRPGARARSPGIQLAHAGRKASTRAALGRRRPGAASAGRAGRWWRQPAPLRRALAGAGGAGRGRDRRGDRRPSPPPPAAPWPPASR